MRGTLLALTMVGIALIAGSLSMLMLGLQPPLQGGGVPLGKATVTFVLYAGEPSATAFAFGLRADNLTSPGPVLVFGVSDVVNVTIVNVGRVSHAFAVTDAPKTNGKTLFGAAIASASMPLNPGKKGTVLFKATAAGNYFYICPVPGHPELGMWGRVIVNP